MLDCLIIGDSIAVGTAMARPECVSYAKGGWNSQQWNNKYLNKVTNQPAKTVIISLGTNDHSGVHTFKELIILRDSIQADKVYWILPPIKPDIQNNVKIIANNYNDIVLPIQKLSNDKVHPTKEGYKILAGATK